MANRVLHVMQASGQFTDTREALEADLEFIIAQDPDIVGFTEIRESDGRAQVLQRVARATSNYVPVVLPSGTQFMVKTGDNQRLKSRGAVKVHPGDQSGPNPYAARYVAWVEVSFFGNTIWAHEAHWVTKAEDGGIRKERHVLMSNMLAAQVRKHSRGKDMSIFMGDVNADPDKAKYPREIFKENGLLTIWDEYNVQPVTTGRSTLDIVGRYKPDQRLTGKRYKVHPYKRSDHRFVSVWYEIDNSKPGNPNGGGGGDDWEPVGGGNTGGNGGSTGGTNPNVEDDDFYATAGNVDWSDYMDDSIYDLPSAVEDSDSTN